MYLRFAVYFCRQREGRRFSRIEANNSRGLGVKDWPEPPPKQRHSSNGRLILWGHQEHLGKTVDIQSVKPLGKWLDEHYHGDYFVIGSSAGGGQFNVLAYPNTKIVTTQYMPITQDSYESNFRSAAIPMILIPLHGDLPDWLASRHHLRGGSAVSAYDLTEDLKVKLDAIVYIDQTTRSSNFW